MYNEEAAKYGATMATGFVLLSIDKEKGTPSTTLGPKMGMEATSLTRTLKSMEEKGLIYRKPNPEDGRGVLIFLTEFGKEKRELLTWINLEPTKKDAQDIRTVAGNIQINKVITAKDTPPLLYPIKVNVWVEVAPGIIWQKEYTSINSIRVISFLF